MYEERSRVVAAVAAGHSLRAIGRRFEIAPRTALRWYLEAVPDDPETVAAALEVLALGYSVRDVANAARAPATSVRRWARMAGRAHHSV